MCGGGGSSWFDWDTVAKAVGIAGTAATAGAGVYSALKSGSYANESSDDGAADAQADAQAASEAAAQETRQRALAARTRKKSTMLTGTGLSSTPNTSLKRLFGGN